VTHSFEDEVASLGVAFSEAQVLDVPDRQLIRLPQLSLGDPQWTPTVARGLLVCDGWPQQRPQLLLGDELRRHDQEPPNFSRQFVSDEGWFGYSFQAPYNPDYPALVPVVRGWLRRFDGRQD
jgi:hypothetical protein